MKVDRLFAVPSSDAPILGHDKMELIADYGTPDVYAVALISATDWEAEQSRIAALEKDAARFRSLQWRFEAERDFGPGGRWIATVHTDNPRIRNNVIAVIDAAMQVKP